MDNALIITLMGLVVIVCLVAGIITFRISKRVEREQERRKQHGETAEDELERSHEYEERSLKSNLPNLVRIYVVSFSIALVAFIVFAAYLI